MPGFTMCTDYECQEAEQCVRSMRSGTKPKDEGQSFDRFFIKDSYGNCVFFKPKRGD